MNDRAYHYIPTRGYDDSSLHPGSWIGGVLVILLILLWPAIGLVAAHAHNRTETIRVTRLDDQATGQSGHQYLIFTPEGVFKDTDNFWDWKFDSSDVFNDLQAGHRYRCRIHGTRNHFTSNYPDIMSCVAA